MERGCVLGGALWAEGLRADAVCRAVEVEAVGGIGSKAGLDLIGGPWGKSRGKRLLAFVDSYEQTKKPTNKGWCRQRKEHGRSADARELGEFGTSAGNIRYTRTSFSVRRIVGQASSFTQFSLRL